MLHVANEFHAWEFCSDDLSFVQLDGKWPVDRVLAEASLDLSRFLEPSIASLKKCTRVSKRVVLVTNCRSRGRRKSRSRDYVATPPRRITPLAVRVDYRSGYPIEPVPGFVDCGTPAIETLARQAPSGFFQVAANAHCQHLKTTCA